MSAIVINNLTKRIGRNKIFSNLNLEVMEGEIFALLGLEKSGKTTLAKILFNYYTPPRGKAYIYDMDCSKESKTIKESVSYVPQSLLYQDNLKAGTIFRNTLSFHNLKNTDEISNLTSYFNFNPRVKFGDMTDSEKRIMSIINALIIRPRLIVLDEATKELDLEQIEKLFKYLKELRKNEGLSVLFLTDSLVEAQRYCDRAAYLYEGEIKEVEYLKDKVSNDKIIKIYGPFHNLNAFMDIGARLIKNDPFEKIFYYDKDMVILSRVIANAELTSYSIEDSSLSDRITAYFTNDVDYAAYSENVESAENQETLFGDSNEDLSESTKDNTVVFQEESVEDIQELPSDELKDTSTQTQLTNPKTLEDVEEDLTVGSYIDNVQKDKGED
ncbi:MAG: ABC transporter ATP-binding protein [Peptoniphilus sp.]|nr:ABC transporter ATP-binding protein [Peptoniphilus sp.]